MDSMAATNSNQVCVDHHEKSSCGGGGGENGGICTICLEKIDLKEIALIKGCEHAYCVTCILRWATYNQNPYCPQCKHPFEFLIVHRSLDGSIHDYMFEESVCLLTRATWFIPLPVEAHEAAIYDNLEDVYHSEDECDDGYLDEVYFSSSSTLRIGNRRWGDNGIVRGGRKEARPISREEYLDHPEASSSRGPKKKEAAQNTTGRRAKRALKREGADKAAQAVAASKHQQHLARLGRLPKVVVPAAAEMPEGADKAAPAVAASKHQQHLARLGRLPKVVVPAAAEMPEGADNAAPVVAASKHQQHLARLGRLPKFVDPAAAEMPET